MIKGKSKKMKSSKIKSHKENLTVSNDAVTNMSIDGVRGAIEKSSNVDDGVDSNIRKNRRKYLIIGLSLLVIVMVILGIGLYFNDASNLKNPPMKNINVALNWIHHAEFAGNYVAAQKGFYSKAGINATLIAYDFNRSTIDLVTSGSAEFGITSASELILARSKGVPIKAVAVIYQVDPVCAFTLKSSGIATPKDFVGKKIGIEKDVDNVKYEYIAMMDNLHINRSQLTEVDIGYDAAELLNGSVDVSTGYVTNEPYYVIAAGQDVNIIMVEDYGITIYSDVLFTTDDMIDTNPDLVNRFVQSTLDGWQYALEHEDEALNIVMQYAKDADKAHENYALKTSLPLISTGDVQIGYMDKDGWISVQKILQLEKIPLDNLTLSDCYTTQFINQRDAWQKKR